MHQGWQPGRIRHLAPGRWCQLQLRRHRLELRPRISRVLSHRRLHRLLHRQPVHALLLQLGQPGQAGHQARRRGGGCV
jgi:hypothetical protein